MERKEKRDGKEMLAKYMVYKGHIRIRRLAHIGSEERMNKLKMKMKKTADVRPVAN